MLFLQQAPLSSAVAHRTVPVAITSLLKVASNAKGFSHEAAHLAAACMVSHAHLLPASASCPQAFAGVAPQVLQPGTVAYIGTGGPLPEGADAG